MSICAVVMDIMIIEITKRELTYFCVDEFYSMIAFIESIAKKHNIKVNSYDADTEHYLIECKTEQGLSLSLQLDNLNIKHTVYYGD